MKVSETRQTTRTLSVEKAQKTGAPSKVSSLQSLDEFVLAGVPEAELTPKVKAALTSLMDEVHALKEEVSATKARLSELETLADRDPLLETHNRRAFVRELGRAIAMTTRYGVRACLVFIDIDDLKSVNDRFGHQAGDKALLHVSTLILENIRQTDILGRLGGDELGLLLLHVDRDATAAKVMSLADKIYASPLSLGGEEFRISFSFGIAELAPGADTDDVLQKADNSMYAAKRKNKDV